MGKMTFRVCVPCQRGDCDCQQYDGLDIEDMPKGWKAHDDSVHGHNCYCVFDVEGSLESEINIKNAMLYVIGEMFLDKKGDEEMCQFIHDELKKIQMKRRGGA